MSSDNGKTPSDFTLAGRVKGKLVGTKIEKPWKHSFRTTRRVVRA